MKLLDLTLPSIEGNLALDEALLEEAELSQTPTDILRLWLPTEPAVVIGRSSLIAEEVDLPYCEEQGIPVHRRSSGGAAIVTGPGCLMYAVLLSYELRPELQSLDEAHRFVLTTILSGLAPLVSGVARKGTSDLAIGDKKFSGNSLRCKRRHLLYHGTLLYDFPLELISACLRTAPRQPSYRVGRDHNAFVTNLPLRVDQLRSAMIRAWIATAKSEDWPKSKVEQLVQSKYSQRDWNHQR